MIGAEVCKVLETKGIPFEGITFENKSGIGKSHYHSIDLASKVSIKKIEALNPCLIIHCAAIIPGSKKENHGYLEINERIDKNIIEASSRTGSKLIYLSSTAVYGFPLETVAFEKDGPQTELTSYGLYKRKSEAEILKKNIKALILRVNAPYSYSQSTKTILWRFINDAKRNLPLKYYGKGQRRQDFTYVGDIAELIIDNLEFTVSGIFNISTGNPISMFELAHKIKNTIPGCASSIIPAGIVDDQENHSAEYDLEKARKHLGWKSQFLLEDFILNMSKRI